MNKMAKKGQKIKKVSNIFDTFDYWYSNFARKYPVVYCWDQQNEQTS